MEIVTASEMKEIEQKAGELGMSGERLMENAGAAAAAVLKKTIDPEDKNCILFCGRGNNGGDGFVVARKLYEDGANVAVVLTDGEPRTEDAKSMFDMVKMMGISVLRLEESFDQIAGLMDVVDIIVDGVYGTGFHGELDELHQKACALMNNAIAAVFSLDVPSGVDCDAAKAAEGAVQADFTIAFDHLKPCHILAPGKGNCGYVELCAIGIPQEAADGVKSHFHIPDEEMVFALLPQREPESHKGSYGRLLSVCGSENFVGAAVLSAMGAMRCGVGLIQLASTQTVCHIAASRLIECTYLPLVENSCGRVPAEAIGAILKRMKRSTAALVGCGLGCDEDTEQVVSALIRRANCPLVIDADGINAVAKNINILSEKRDAVILTPHPGEMARLVGKEIEDVERDRLSIARAFAQEHGVTLVLKGHNTLVACPDGNVFYNTTGNAGLAKGGSGDVLAGMIAGFAAQGIKPELAAVLGVYLHGMAADACAKRLSQYAMQPSDILEDLCRIFVEHQL